MKTLLTTLFLILFSMTQAQNVSSLPYYELPNAPTEYTNGAIVSRMIDGLGFRFYWASEGLTDKDLNYKANPDGRTSLETIDHILDLSHYILNTALNQPNNSETTNTKKPISYQGKRKKTLENLQQASEIYLKTIDLTKNKIVFKTNKKETSFPFWNMLNGPIADALTHCGQLAIYRRTTGNPINKNANVLTGKVKTN